MRTVPAALLIGALLLAACSREQAEPGGEPSVVARGAAPRAPIVTVSADQAVSPVPAWQAPQVEVTDENFEALRERARSAEAAGELVGSPGAAIPIYLALQKQAPGDKELGRSLSRATDALLAQGDAAIASIDADPGQLRRAHEIGAVARALAPEARKVMQYLDRVEVVDQAQRANRLGEVELNEGRIGEDGEGGALGYFREALELRPGDVRALQGLAAAESALIRLAEKSAADGDYESSEGWLQRAAEVREEDATVDDARLRIAEQRRARIGDLRDLGIAALSREDGLDEARARLADLLRIAAAGDPAAADLRERIDLATHYGLFRPGQAFTDGLRDGGRGPEMVVIPHGAFRMGAADGEAGATDAERPARNIRFPRGLAVAQHEVTVGEFGRFINATGHRTRAARRGYSTAYDERSGNLVRRSGVDWRSDYAGRPADARMPVVHVSARDAMAYAEWLSAQTGQSYRLPSEAEFEYALRAGSQGRFPWGDGAPPGRAGNFTGDQDVSPSGRRWRNAFEDYGDGAWGPALTASYLPNGFGLHDMPGNVSEWVADCWHDSYRRAPGDAQAWVNPGCRARVIRGGSWASAPVQTRSAWRLSGETDTTNARLGFRVVRDI